MRFISNCKINGFTLAEILVALTIIGVIAAINIPTLINNIGEQQNKIAWKKAFADLSQVTMKMAADNGGGAKGLFSSRNDAADKYAAYLNYTKKCYVGLSKGNCWHNSFKYLNGSDCAWGDHAALVLNNGMLLYFFDASIDCSIHAPQCLNIAVDVNGFKGPNIYGKDILRLFIYDNYTQPFGVRQDWPHDFPQVSCIEGSTEVTNTGTGCSALYLYQ